MPNGLLKLDIDSGERMPNNRTIDHRLARAGFRRKRISRKRSPGGLGWHVTLEVDPSPASPLIVVALQAILGSDPQREACNLVRAIQYDNVTPFWRDRWNVLYG